MKLTSLLILAGIIQVVALNSYSQSTKLTMDFRNVSVVDVLRAIEDKSEYYFVYNKDAIDLDRKLDLNAKELRIEEVLDNILKEPMLATGWSTGILFYRLSRPNKQN